MAEAIKPEDDAKAESKSDDKNEKNVDIEQKQVEQWLKLGQAEKKKLDELLQTLDTFTPNSNTSVKYEICGQSVELPVSISYKKKTNPLVWCAETIVPGNHTLAFDSWTSNTRPAWDQNLITYHHVNINKNANPNLFLLNFELKGAGGGLISPRDFVDLVYVEQPKDTATVFAGKSIQYDPIPAQKDFVRAQTVLAGCVFETIAPNEVKDKYKIPELVTDSGEVCEWTTVRYIQQTDIKGWILSSVVNTAMNTTLTASMKSLQNYHVNTRVKFKSTS